MLVKEWMSTKVLTVDQEMSMMEAGQFMTKNNLRRMPVLSQGRLVGVVSDRDIKAASPSKATTLDIHELYYLLAKLKVKDVMTKNPITISPEDTVEKAAVVMAENRISGLPVVNEKGDLVGFLTQGDVFRVLISITGIYRGGVLFAFNLPDQPGSIKEVSDLIRAAGGRLNSILTSYDTAADGSRHVFVRAVGIGDERLPALLEELKQKSDLLYHVKDEISEV